LRNWCGGTFTTLSGGVSSSASILVSSDKEKENSQDLNTCWQWYAIVHIMVESAAPLAAKKFAASISW
jgi:hypothetical protein